MKGLLNLARKDVRGEEKSGLSWKSYWSCPLEPHMEAWEENSGEALSWRLKKVNDKLESSVRVFLVPSKTVIGTKILM